MTTIGKLGLAATALVLGFASCTSKDYILRGDAGSGTGGAEGIGGYAMGGHPGTGGYGLVADGGRPGTGGGPGTGGYIEPGTGGRGTGGYPPGTGGDPGTGGTQPGTGGKGTGGTQPGTGGNERGTGGVIETVRGTGGSMPCAPHATLADCESRAECHSVFIDPGTCGCAGAGCCARFSFCADGDQAQCKPVPLACAIATPYCESPYVVAYLNSCFEGCVKLADCAP